MLIDFHTHTFPDKIAAAALKELSERSGIFPHTDGTAQGLMDAMARDGVDLSVVLPVATNPAQVEKINRRALEANASSDKTGLISFGAMHPDFADYKTERQGKTCQYRTLYIQRYCFKTSWVDG